MLPRTLLLLFVLLANGIILPVQAALPAEIDGKPLPSLAPMLESVTPAVVNISTKSEISREENPLFADPFFRHFFGDITPRQKQTQSLGSGVIVDARKGLVLTNNHVVEKAQEIKITLHDGRKFEAELIGADPEMDLAVLKIPGKNLSDLRLADSSKLRVGDFVVAIGNPFGLSQTVTSGIVSALGRSGLGIEGYESFIQTDASINPGNSGGPLVNLRGELVGINTAILAPTGGNVGIGFAIPTNIVRIVMQQLIQHGEVRRGQLGIQTQTLTPDLAEALGVAQLRGTVVSKIQPESAAERGGLQPGDVITSVDKVGISSASDFEIQTALKSIGDEVRLGIVRKGKLKVIRVTIADPFDQFIRGKDIGKPFRGAIYGEVRDESQYGTFDAISVARVKRDGSAWKIGLRDGDVLVQVNRKRVKSLKQLKQMAQSKNGIQELRLRRGDSIVTIR